MAAKLRKVKNEKNSGLRQALRSKVTSMKFNLSNPGYFVGKVDIIDLMAVIIFMCDMHVQLILL